MKGVLNMSPIREKFVNVIESLPYNIDEEVLKKKYERNFARSNSKIC